MILHILKPRPVLRIVKQVRNQWLLLSFSTFNSELAGAFPAELVESLYQSHRRGTLDRSARSTWAAARAPRPALGQAFPQLVRHSMQSSGGWGRGSCRCPSARWKSPASPSTWEKAVDRRRPAGGLLACQQTCVGTARAHFSVITTGVPDWASSWHSRARL